MLQKVKLLKRLQSLQMSKIFVHQTTQSDIETYEINSNSPEKYQIIKYELKHNRKCAKGEDKRTQTKYTTHKYNFTLLLFH